MTNFEVALTSHFIKYKSFYYYQDISNFNEYATSLWIDPPVNPRLKIYVFNFTNPDEFLTGAKPKFEELGPYVFS